MRALVGLAFLVNLVNPFAWEPGDDWRADQCEKLLMMPTESPRYVGVSSMEASYFWVFTGWMELKLWALVKPLLVGLLNIVACRKQMQLHGLRTIVDGDLNTTHLFAIIIKSSVEGI